MYEKNRLIAFVTIALLCALFGQTRQTAFAHPGHDHSMLFVDPEQTEGDAETQPSNDANTTTGSRALSPNFTRDFAIGYQKVANSDFEIVANTIVIDAVTGQTIDIDGTSLTNNSSAATLNMPANASIQRAYLIVQGTI